MQDADAHPAGVHRAGQGEHRHAHPERVAARGVAVERPGVEHDIPVRMGAQVVVEGHVGMEVHPRGIGAGSGHGRGDPCAGLRCVSPRGHERKP